VGEAGTDRSLEPDGLCQSSYCELDFRTYSVMGSLGRVVVSMLSLDVASKRTLARIYLSLSDIIDNLRKMLPKIRENVFRRTS